jgi:alpha-tubulin suppressor-like RCC1 family protein
LSAQGTAKEVSVLAAGYHSLALDDQGRLWAWGWNFYGELGDGTMTDRWTPVQVDLSALGTAKVLSVQTGSYHSLALDDQGRLWAWGKNYHGELGDGTGGNSRPSPVQVELSALGTAKLVSMQAAGYHSLALDEQGRLWAWGWNSDGELGDGTRTDRWTPVQVDLSALGMAKLVSVHAGGNHSLALDDQGRLWAWGRNDHGALGDGTTTDRLSPVQVLNWPPAP